MECNRVSVRPIVRLRRAGHWPPTSTRVPVSASPPAHGLKQHHELIHLENRVCYLLGHPSVEWGDAGVTIAKLLISQIIKWSATPTSCMQTKDLNRDVRRLAIRINSLH